MDYTSGSEELDRSRPGLEASATRIRLYVFLLWLVILLFYSYTALRVPGRDSFLSPDENNTYNVARSLEEDGTIYLHSTLNERFGVDYFRARNYVETAPNTFTAYNSLGLSILVAAGMRVGLGWMVVPLLASLGVLGAYLIGRRLAGWRAGLLAGLLYGLLPTNLFNSNLLLDIVPSVSLFLLALGLALTSLYTRSRVTAFACGCALGLSFFIRQALGVFVPLLLLWLAINWKRFSLRLLLPSLAPAALIASAAMLMNKAVYGSFVSSGQFSATGNSPAENLTRSYDLIATTHSVYTHVAQYLPLLFLLGFAGLAFCLARERRRPLLSFHLLMALFLLLAVVFFGSREGTWSFAQFNVSASMARYFTPVYAVLAIYASVLLSLAFDRGKGVLASLVVVAVLCSYCAFAFGSVEYTDLPYLKGRFTEYTTRKQALLEGGLPTVVFTRLQDKDLYNDVEVGLCFTEADWDGDPASFPFPLIDPAQDVLPVIEQLRKEGWRVLVCSDAPEVMEACEAKGYKLEMIKSWPRTYLVRKIGPLK